MEKIDVSIVLACFNEGWTFEKSVNAIVSVLKKTKYKWEIIFVEDKSVDDTRKTILALSKKIKGSKIILHKQNLGRGKSVADGIFASDGAICGYLDVDLEVAADYIPLFISEIEKGTDVVVGRRFYEKSSILRFVLSRLYATLVGFLINLPIEDTEAGYKFFRKKNILPILSQTRDKKWFWDTEICARAYWAGLNVRQIPVLFVRRDEKLSTVRIVPDTIEYLKQLFKFRLEHSKEINKSK